MVQSVYSVKHFVLTNLWTLILWINIVGGQHNKQAASLYKRPVESPCKFPVAQQTYVRDSKDCSIFYTCYGNRYWKLSCSTPYTVWSLKYKVCVWKHSPYDDCDIPDAGLTTPSPIRRTRKPIRTTVRPKPVGPFTPPPSYNRPTTTVKPRTWRPRPTDRPTRIPVTWKPSKAPTTKMSIRWVTRRPPTLPPPTKKITKRPTPRPTTKPPKKTQKPTTKKPVTHRPITKKPTRRPITKRPTTRRPFTSKPTTRKPFTWRPTTRKPFTRRPSTRRPIPTRRVTKTPKPIIRTTARPRQWTQRPTLKPIIRTTDRPKTWKPITKRPITKKPITKKPITKRPTTKRPTTRRPTTRRPTRRPTTKKPTKPTTRTTTRVTTVRKPFTRWQITTTARPPLTWWPTRRPKLNQITTQWPTRPLYTSPRTTAVSTTTTTPTTTTSSTTTTASTWSVTTPKTTTVKGPITTPRRRPTYNEQCGVMSEPMIIGGALSKPRKWPWQVSLQIIAAVEPWHRCGGVLIHPQWVLTAAHCVEGQFYGDIRNWRVVLSEDNLEIESGREIYRRIERIISHPGYIRTSNFPNDLALLQLDEPVDVSSGEASVACLPQDEDLSLLDNTKCWISGWGETRGSGGVENAMNELSVDILPNWLCSSMWRRVGIHVLDDQVCVGYGETGACYGDSGGPLMCEIGGRYYVTGVMSWLINNCSARGFPNVFTRVTSYLDWIYEKLEYYDWWRYN